MNQIIKELNNNSSLSDSVLRQKYIEPPFSVLDTKLKFWKTRRDIWYKLNIQSELGRGDKYSGYSNYGDWIIKKGWTKNGNFKGQETKLKISIFDPVLCELMYEWFCPSNGKVLDPFAGGSVRGIVASIKGFDYCGIELNPEQVKSNREQAKQICTDNIPQWIKGDSDKELDKYVDSCDFVFSCPPYFDLETYTDIDGDLSLLSDIDFLDKYESIISKSVSKLKDNRFACFVVGEVRSSKTGFYKNLVSNTIECFEKAGCHFYNDIVLLRPVANGAMRVPKQFPNYRKVVRIHQNVLIFYKGNNHRNIKDIERFF
jgi:DNA modification methylase|tara:strand:+ start:521 stop:1465 length:945 start_codon:yes stop_codon:yes gene_type:complete